MRKFFLSLILGSALFSCKKEVSENVQPVESSSGLLTSQTIGTASTVESPYFSLNLAFGGGYLYQNNQICSESTMPLYVSAFGPGAEGTIEVYKNGSTTPIIQDFGAFMIPPGAADYRVVYKLGEAIRTQIGFSISNCTNPAVSLKPGGIEVAFNSNSEPYRFIENISVNIDGSYRLDASLSSNQTLIHCDPAVPESGYHTTGGYSIVNRKGFKGAILRWASNITGSCDITPQPNYPGFRLLYLKQASFKSKDKYGNYDLASTNWNLTYLNPLGTSESISHTSSFKIYKGL